MSTVPATPQAQVNAEWARTPERSNAVALRIMTWVAVKLGRLVARWVLHPITLYFLLFAPTVRRHSARFLARALGRTADVADIYRHLHTFAVTLLDRVYLLRGRLDLFDVRVQGRDVIESTLAGGRGAFLVGAHMGSFEAMRSLGESQAGLRVAMVMYPDNANRVNQALQAIAPETRAHVIALGRVESMLAVRDWLDSGGLAGMLADRTLGTSAGGEGEVITRFLGREAAFGDGPFRLAALLRRRVVFMAGLYLGGNSYELRFEPLADFTERMSADERDSRIREAVLAYAARVEALCREHPYNWFNFHDFWRENSVG